VSFSTLVFLFVLMFSFGFITQQVRRFAFWRFVLLASLLTAFLVSFGFTKEHLMVMFISFFVGYLLPYASVLRGIGEALSDFINSIRYRDAYEDIKRKEEEVEELRRQYEEARANAQANRDTQEEARRKRQKESEGFRQKQKSQNEKKKSKSGSGRSQHSSDSKHSSSRSDRSYRSGQQSHTQNEPVRECYLIILGLDPHGSYTLADIKKAFRKKAMEVHPDRHMGKSNYKEMEAKFKQVNDAYEWLMREL
jgi:F0F1-type ATP synthase membrane subunit b/b'